MGRIERTRELARRRARKKKLKKLREQHAQAQNETEKQVIAEKAYKVSPFATFE